MLSIYDTLAVNSFNDSFIYKILMIQTGRCLGVGRRRAGNLRDTRVHPHNGSFRIFWRLMIPQFAADTLN